MLHILITKLYTTLEKSPESKEVYKQIRCRLLKYYSAYIYEEALGRVDLPNCHNFENINDAYSNFFQKVMEVVDLVAPIKSRQIKQNPQEWFDGEVAEKIHDKLIKNIAKSHCQKICNSSI